MNHSTSPVQMHHQKDYQKIMLCKVSDGKEIMALMQGVCGISYDEETRTLEEVKIVSDFIQYIKELIDIDDLLEEPSDRIMTAFNLTESVKELDRIGFWVFAGIENRKLTGGQGNSDNFPVLLMRIVNKENSEIVKTKPV